MHLNLKSNKLENKVLTICSVYYSQESLKIFKLNIQLIQSLNRNTRHRWFVADNSFSNELSRPSGQKLKLFTGAKKRNIKSPGSYQHAEALNKLIKYIKTRYVLFLDYDFFIIRKNWIREILDYMQINNLAFFGTPFHPKWYDKYRYFPSVQCMFVDLSKIDKNKLDFRPEIVEPILSKVFSTNPLKLLLYFINKNYFSIGTTKDTGYKVYKRFYGKVNFEIALPVLDNKSINSPLLNILPESFSLIPKKSESYTNISFKNYKYPDIKKENFEEYIWQNNPFAFHLRGKKNISEKKNNFELAKKIIKQLMRHV